MSWGNEDNRAYFRENLGQVYTHYTPTEVKNELVKSPYEGIKCPCCGNVSHIGASKEQIVERFAEDNGFLCYFCFNTGEAHTDDSQVAATIYQHKDKVIDVIKQTGLVPRMNKSLTHYSGDKKAAHKSWHEYVSIDASSGTSKIIITLPEGDKTHSFSLRQWKTRLGSKLRQAEGKFVVDSDAARGVKTQEHLNRLQKIHPNGRIIDLKPAKTNSLMNCGEVSVFGEGDNQIVVQHPNFELDVAKTQRRIKEGGDKACCCVICASEKQLPSPSTPKTIELANKMWEYHAAKVASKLGLSDISGISVKRQDGTEGKLNTTKEKLSFQCHNPDHEPTVDTYSNRLNVKRSGYCKQCLKDAGVKNISEL